MEAKKLEYKRAAGKTEAIFAGEKKRQTNIKKENNYGNDTYTT